MSGCIVPFITLLRTPALWCPPELRIEPLTFPDLHPALPGQFNGANAIQRAYAAFQNKEIDHTGIMIHYVISEVDMGEPIVVKEIEMKEGEPETALEERIHQSEWELIVRGTKMALEKLRSKGKEDSG